MSDNTFLRRFQRALRPGAYLRVIAEGDVGAGDAIVVRNHSLHGITLRHMVESLDDDEKAAALRALPDLPPFWRKIADGDES